MVTKVHIDSMTKGSLPIARVGEGWRQPALAMTTGDLNSIISEGFYKSNMSLNVWTNLPPQVGSDGAFTLYVESISGTEEYVRQTFRRYDSNRSYVRVKDQADWKPWEAQLYGTVTGDTLNISM